MTVTGRPLGWSQEIQDEMVAILKDGNYVETACAIVGLAKSTFYDWTNWGRQARDKVNKDPNAKLTKNERICLDFSDAIKKASAEAEARDLYLIGQAAKYSWQAAAWRLERKFPDRWGRKTPRDADEQDARIKKLNAETEKVEVETKLATQTDEDMNKPIKDFTDSLSTSINTEGIYDDPATE